MNTLPSPRLQWADNIRALACISVIMLHVAGGPVCHFCDISLYHWWWSNIYDGLARYCVPLFVMLTGALTLGKEYELKAFFKKSFMRIILPFLFWLVIYIFFVLYFDNPFEGEKVDFAMASDWLITQLQYGPSTHFWYIYMIIGIYLFIPIISKWIRHASEKEIVYFICIWLVACFAVLPWVKSYFPKITLSYFSGYIGFLVLGYYLCNKEIQTIKISKRLAAGMFVCGTCITIVGTYLMLGPHGRLNETLYENISPSVILSSIGVFIWIKESKNENKFINACCSFISKYSFGIYFVHVIYISLLDLVGINNSLIDPAIGTPITVVASLLLSLITIISLRKLPYGNYFAG